ncbi:hypothetical protein EAE96_003377 [Botrytis aclada]|nr:hypothetical protein EAE96_003377 [Botrytis aclada]
MASNSEGSPDDVPDNIPPLTASTSTLGRAISMMHEPSSTERSFRTSSSTSRFSERNPVSVIISENERRDALNLERARRRIHEMSSTERSSSTRYSIARVSDGNPLPLFVPRARGRPSTNRTPSTLTVDGSGSERLSYADFRARRVDRTRRLSDRFEPYNLNSQGDRRPTPRVNPWDNLEETPSNSGAPPLAQFGRPARGTGFINGRDPNRVYTPTLYDSFTNRIPDGYSHEPVPGGVYPARRTRPFPLTTAIDALDPCRINTMRRETYRPRVTATISSANITNPVVTASSSVDFTNPVPVSTPNSEQAQTTPEVSPPQAPETSTADSTNDCPICLSPFPAPPNAILVYPCNHEFCLVCIQTWIQTQRQRRDARPVNCPFCRGPIRRIIDREGNIVEYQRNVSGTIAEARERMRRMLRGAVANVADSSPRASRAMGGVDLSDELRRTLNRVGPAGNISEQVARVRERLEDADADSSRPANPLDLPNGALGWWT